MLEDATEYGQAEIGIEPSLNEVPVADAFQHGPPTRMRRAMVQEGHRDKELQRVETRSRSDGRPVRRRRVPEPLLQVGAVAPAQHTAMACRRRLWMGERHFGAAPFGVELRTEARHCKLQGEPIHSRLRLKRIRHAAEQRDVPPSVPIPDAQELFERVVR